MDRLVHLERSEEGWIQVDKNVKCEHSYKENVTRKTRRGRRCVEGEKKEEQENI